jgi:aspartate/methionine/tyrosine aminotransferase
VRPHRRVVVTAGSNLGFMNAVLAITDPGDEIILPVPFYFNHEMAVVMAGARVTPVATRADHQLDLDAIGRAIGPRTRAVVTVSPNNPTGAMYPEADLRAVNALCRDRGVWHISDEAYEYFTYGGAPHFSAGSIDGADAHTIALFSLSKAYGMAGWRMGYMVIPESLWDAVNKIQDTILICPPLMSQAAALAALRVGRGYAAAHMPALERMRARVTSALGAGDRWSIPPIAGAFYAFVRVDTRLDSLDVAERLVRDHRVAVIPGSAFGAARGCYLRVGFGALDERTVDDGLARLVEGLQAIASSRA